MTLKQTRLTVVTKQRLCGSYCDRRVCLLLGWSVRSFVLDATVVIYRKVKSNSAKFGKDVQRLTKFQVKTAALKSSNLKSEIGLKYDFRQNARWRPGGGLHGLSAYIVCFGNCSSRTNFYNIRIGVGDGDMGHVPSPPNFWKIFFGQMPCKIRGCLLFIIFSGKNVLPQS